MEDTSFLYFTQDKIIDKLDIDPRIIESFKRVMKKFQQQFNAYGYTNERNYQEYLEKYLLNSNDFNLRIYVSDEPMKIGASGFYNRSKHLICIDETLLKKDNDVIDATLYHEFVHFLVMHGLDKLHSNEEIYNGGFINEALTEMLTRLAYPNNKAYDAQIAMMKFANLLSDKVNNYSSFLKGSIDSKITSSGWNHFVEQVNLFQQEFNKGYINLKQARSNENFIEAQRKLLNLFINPYTIKDVNEYIEKYKKILKRPVEDKEFIDNLIKKMDESLINNLSLKDENIKKLLKDKLNELRKEITVQINYAKDAYEINFEGRTLYLDSELNFYGDTIGIVRGFNPNTNEITLMDKDNRLVIDLNKIDFKNIEEKRQEKINNLCVYFSKNMKSDLEMISKTKDEKNLKKIESFSLPILNSNNRKMPITVYVATYSDKVVILSNNEKIGTINNIDLNHFIGLTSTNLKNAAVYSKKLSSLEKGYVFSPMSQNLIELRTINNLKNKLSKELSQEQLKNIIDSYRQNNHFEEEELEYLEEDALLTYTKKYFETLSQDKQQYLLNEVINNNERFVLSVKNGDASVSLLFGDKYKTAFEGEKTVLIDKSSQGLYNEFLNDIYNSITPNKAKTSSFELNNLGSLIVKEDILKKLEQLSNIKIDLNFLTIQEAFKEQQMLYKKIEELYDEDKIDFETKKQMKQELIQVFEKAKNNFLKEEPLKNEDEFLNLDVGNQPKKDKNGGKKWMILKI